MADKERFVAERLRRRGTVGYRRSDGSPRGGEALKMVDESESET